MDNIGKGGLPPFWELSTVIHYASNDFKRQYHRCLETFMSQIKNQSFLKVEEGTLWFLAQNIRKQQS